MKKSIYINQLFALVIIVVLTVSCGTNTKRENASSVASDEGKIQTVEVVKPQKRSFAAQRLITGAAHANRKIVLYAMESGYVESMRKDIGDAVKEGEIIAILKNPELIRQLENKQAQLGVKKNMYERLKSIYKKTPALTSIHVVETAEADYLSAKADVSIIQDRLNFLKVKAPFLGTITQRFIDKGTLVQSGLTQSNPQGIVELQQLNPIRLTIPVPESDLAIIDKGTKVSVYFPELPGTSFNSIVSRTSGALDPASRTMRVEIDIDNPKGMIKPGMYAKVEIQINSSESVASLPVTAQLKFQDKNYLYVVTDDKVSRIPLKKGLSNKDFFEVLNNDISDESMVIVRGKNLVKPGQIVEPILKVE
jgi:membrane fusion protein (multidrug efflux system)